MKKICKILCVLMLLVLCGGLFVCCEQPDNPTNGQSWTVGGAKVVLDDDTLILHVSGEGALNVEGEAPWQKYSVAVSGIEIAEGITEISGNAFLDMPNASYLLIADSLTQIAPDCMDQTIKLFYFESCQANLADFDSSRLYLYSDALPSGEQDYYWRYDENNLPCAWDLKRVLFVGNSFTYAPGKENVDPHKVPMYFKQIADAAGVYVKVDSFVKGSWTFEYWMDDSYAVSVPVIEAIKNNQYDLIVLQEQSTQPIASFNKFYFGATKFNDFIKEHQDNAQVILFATWGYPAKANNYGGSVQSMQERLSAAYDQVAEKIGAKVSPVGAAFTEVYNTQDSHGIYVIGSDNHHQTEEGAFLAGLVHARVVLGIDVTGNTASGPFDATTESEKIQFLQEVAMRVTQSN